jgi:hypothetical protein
MTRIHLFRKQDRNSSSAVASSVTWGKTQAIENLFDSSSPWIFAALLIACSLAVGCSNNKPQPASTNNPRVNVPIATSTTPSQVATATPAPVAPAPQTEQRMRKKIVHKAPATLAYADKTTGISFQYPRGYALKTGDSATELLATDLIPMDFTQPGGTTLAAVTLPESAYPKSDLAAAYFDVSMNKALAADQCGEFSVPQNTFAASGNVPVQATAQVAAPPISKLLIGDMELQSSEAEAGGETEKGTRDESSKYYHVFQNGVCYEFALKVSTVGADSKQASDDTKHVDREEVFRRLEKILATVKIDPVSQEMNTEVKTDTDTKTSVVPAGNPAQ